MRFAKVKLQGGGSYVEPISNLGGLIEDIREAQVGEVYTVEVVEMTPEAFEALPDFEGH